jgi:hypothetical protein
MFRAMFILCIVTVAILSAECVFIIATLNESSNFQEAYEAASVSIINNFYQQMNNALWNARGITNTIGISYSDASWPNVTISNFPTLCESTLVLSQASAITFQPMIHTENRHSWEIYASLFFPLTQQKGRGNQTTDDKVDYFGTNRSWNDGIYRFDNRTAFDNDSNSSIMFPIWQMYPLPKELNQSNMVGSFFDEHSNPVRKYGIQSMMNRNGSAISSFLFQDTNTSDVAFYHAPHSNLYYPIFDGIGDDKRITGSINLQITWDAMLQGTTLDRNETMIVVIKSSCGGEFSYKVQGDRAYYYGQGQLQNVTVNGIFVSAPSSFDSFASLFDEHGVIPLDTNSSCSYRITVYASQAFKDVVCLDDT